jgi:hypothetical protein
MPSGLLSPSPSSLSPLSLASSPLATFVLLAAAAAFSGCADACKADAGCLGASSWRPEPWRVGDRTEYGFADGRRLAVEVVGEATRPDGFGVARQALVVRFDETGGDSRRGEVFIGLHDRAILAIDWMGPDGHRVAFGQPFADGFVRGQVFGPHPWALAALLQGSEFPLGETTLLPAYGTLLEVTPRREGASVGLSLRFEQNSPPGAEASVRETSASFAADQPLPTAFGSLLGLGEGFDTATQDLFHKGSRAVAWGQGERAKPALAGQQPFREPPRMGSEAVGLTLDEAVAAADRHPSMARFRAAHPNSYVAAALYERNALTGAPAWTVQVGDAAGEPYEVRYEWLDCEVAGIPGGGADGAGLATSCGQLLEPTPVEYSVEHIAVHGLVDLGPLVDAAARELGGVAFLWYAVQAEVELRQGAEEAVLEAEGPDGRAIAYSAVNSQILEVRDP